MEERLSIRGFEIFKAYLSHDDQRRLVKELREVVTAAPLFSPVTPSGRKMSVRMTSAGRYGWVSDKRGYRYADRHPNGVAWPPVPESALSIWHKLVSARRDPDCCLLNFYSAEARMGLHQDRDEADFTWPVLSVSLGDDGLFRMGNDTRGGKTQSVWLSSGDVVVMGGEARLKFHGVDRIRGQSSSLLEKGGRLNLTMRVVD